MITEARLAIVLSAFATAFTGAQWYESHRTNSINDENLAVEILPGDDPSDRVGNPICWTDTTTIDLAWRVSVFNTSIQPVTIQSANFFGSSSAGMSSEVGSFGPHGPTKREFPRTIAARSFDAFVVHVPVQTSPRFGAWLRSTGACNGKPLDVRMAAMKAGFSEAEANVGGASNPRVIALIQTAGGREIHATARWYGR
ncbi:hypothetical protein [Pandoraea pulmonicola]|uniref:Uncharacterized protein n=1 Tax=Pandoraea pulmonicola TaxID=93221 RepID=A0AAJ5D228_PANPU|nr:hypothetical protein [Pandoraea pulmonicola]SUA92272.1 Uncharacterised protein [Pandoraea pulmonicola]